MTRTATPRAVLIIGSPKDPHCECVSAQCSAAGAECRIINEDQLVTLDFTRHEDGGPGVGSAGGDADRLAIWWRLKPGYFRNEAGTNVNQFVKREWNHTLESFEGLFPDAVWINPRATDRFIRHKPNQLKLARQVGFSIPPTLITNDASRVSDLLAQGQGRMCIYKPLSWFADHPNKLLFTSLIDESLVEENARSIERAPGIYQIYMKKAYELRITVVQNEIFAVRLDSQDEERTRLDWRRDMDCIPYKVVPNLPEKFKERLLTFHAKANLVYGAYDFIVTPDDEYVFLEVNQVGQWLWIEDATELPISAAIATALVQGQPTRAS